MIIVYTTCQDEKEARKIGESLLKKRLCGCINILPQMQSLAWWPPHKNKLEGADESVLLIKTVAEKYDEVEAEILKIHSYEVPVVFAIPILRTNEKYLEWIQGEIRQKND